MVPNINFVYTYCDFTNFSKSKFLFKKIVYLMAYCEVLELGIFELCSCFIP